MEKTLSTILQEGADKIRATLTTVNLPTENLILSVKRILESEELGFYEEATANASNRKNAQQIAAGKLLLQMLDKPCWKSFPFKSQNVDEVREWIEQQIEGLNGGIPANKDNGVKKEKNVNKENGSSTPISKPVYTQVSKEHILQLIEPAICSVADGFCLERVHHLKKRGILQQIFNQQVKYEIKSHNSYDPGVILKTLHILNEEAYMKHPIFCKETVLQSFIGMGPDQQYAENEAARNVLKFIKNLYLLPVVN